MPETQPEPGSDQSGGLSPEAFHTLALERGYVPAFGYYATAAAMRAELVASLPSRSAEFVEPSRQPDLTEQLTFMRDLWFVLGYDDMPILRQPEATYARQALERTGENCYRILCVPLMGPLARKSLSRHIDETFPATMPPYPKRSGKDRAPLNVLYETLLDDLNAPVRDGQNWFGLCYKSVNGTFMNRQEYIEAMLQSSQAIAMTAGIVWLYCIVDISDQKNRPLRTPYELLHDLSFAATTEMYLTMYAAKRAAGKQPQNTLALDLINETAFQLNSELVPLRPVLCAAIRHTPYQLGRYALNPGSTTWNPGIRPMLNCLPLH